MGDTKICKACNKELPLTDFYFRKDTGKYRIACKKCKRINTKTDIIANAHSEYKKCKHCGIEKPRDEYQKAGGGKWLQPYCKPCDAERKRKYHVENIDKISSKRTQYYNDNKDKILQREKNRRMTIPKKPRVYNRMSVEEKKRRKSISDKKYRENNKEKINIIKKEYYKKVGLEKKKEWQRKMKDNISFNIKRRLRGRIYVALKKGVKSQRTMDLLDCSIDEFVQYFESLFKDGMNWGEYKKGKIHIDHIKPCVLFDLTNTEEQKKCFHYTNLQPLWAIDNLKKSIKYEE